MVNQKMKLRNSATMTATFILILLVMGMFFGSMVYLHYHLTDTNQTLDEKYDQMGKNLTEQQEDLEKRTQKVRDNLEDMKQSENIAQQVWNGIKGLGSTILLGRGYIDVTTGTYESIVPGSDYIPKWGYPLIGAGILLFIVFLIISVVKGEPKM